MVVDSTVAADFTAVAEPSDAESVEGQKPVTNLLQDGGAGVEAGLKPAVNLSDSCKKSSAESRYT